jgi:flagellin
MVISVNTNVGALNALASASATNKSLETSMARLSSGKRINTASDDAAGLAIASRLTSEIKGTNQAIRNAGDAQSMIDTAEGAHEEITNMLQRMRELAVQAASDTNSDTDRAALQSEVDALLTEVDRIAQTTTWGNKLLLNGSAGENSLAASTSDTADFSFHVGAGSSAASDITASIGAVSSQALGLKGAATTSTSISTDVARISIGDGGVVSIEGSPSNGDIFEIDINDVQVSITYSTTDNYSNDLAGVGAQLKDAIDLLVTAGTIEPAVTVVDNGDGSITVSNDSLPDLDTIVATAGTTTAAGVSISDNVITITGTWEATAAVSLNINGIAVTYTAATTDGFLTTTLAGASAGLKQAIEATDGLEGIIVSDDGAGGLTLTQSTIPTMEGAQTTLLSAQEASMSYGDNGVITIAGTFVAGKTYSMELFGTEISITASTEDAYADTKAGIATQLATAINNAGIHGMTAIRTASANTVTMTGKVTAEDAEVLSSTSTSNYVYTTVDAQSSAIVAISGSTTANTAAGGYAAGDSYSFSVGGEDFTLTVGTDGYTNDKVGVAEQMADLVNAVLNDKGMYATASSTSGATITVVYDLTDTTAGTGNSTVVTDVLVYDGTIDTTSSSVNLSISSTSDATDALDVIDDALNTINTQRASLGAISNRLDSTISNLTNVATNLEASRGRVEDADFAGESSNMAKQQILSQAATAMLAQANASKQGVLQLLQR